MKRYKHNLSFVISSIATTAWMHDHMDVGGRTMPGAIVEKVESRREQRPRNVLSQFLFRRHAGVGDPQDVGNVARGHGLLNHIPVIAALAHPCASVRSDQHPVSRHTGVCQYPVKTIINWMLIFTSMTVKIINRDIPEWTSALFLMALIFCLSASNAFAEDDLGRLFTTPQQRNTLEKLRHQEPVVEIKVPEITFEEPVVETEEQKPVIGGITVNGLVYRKGGKSTAWINSANTYEGNFGNQYIQIDADNIKPDDVEILIPINETKVKLKTGQTYDPEADQIISPGYKDN